MALPEDLLDLADRLATLEPLRPKQASLRRAVSTAYYALFHLLTLEAAKNWKRIEERADLARMLEHAGVKRICIAKRDQLAAARARNSSPATPADRHLHRISDAFAQMHEQREKADYDHSVRWTRVDVLQKIAMVRAAFSSWRAIKRSPDAQRFIASLLIRRR